MVDYALQPNTVQYSEKLIPGKFYIYGDNLAQYFLAHRFLGFDSLGRVLMQTQAGPAEIVGENLTFIGPYDSQQQAISSGYKMYPNASKHYLQQQTYQQPYYYYTYRPPYYQYYPFYTYYYPHWPWRRGWGGWGGGKWWSGKWGGKKI